MLPALDGEDQAAFYDHEIYGTVDCLGLAQLPQGPFVRLPVFLQMLADAVNLKRKMAVFVERL